MATLIQLSIFLLIFYLFALSYIMRSFIPGFFAVLLWIIFERNIITFFVGNTRLLFGMIHTAFVQFFIFLRTYPSVLLLVLLYSALMLSVLDWGLPNAAHPFVYHMDEWHQLQSIQGVFTVGTPNIPGAAHGPQFQWFLSGIYLIPFVLFGIINPFVLSSPLENIAIQKQLFEILRLNTLLFGVMAAYVVGRIATDFFKVHPFLSVFFFLFTPSFLAFSNYYKYDIALLFWIVLACYVYLQYMQTEKTKYMYIAFLVAAAATATKLTAVPLIGIFSLVAFFTARSKKKMIKMLSLGVGIFFVAFCLLGIPDVFFGRGDYYEFFFSNLVSTPSETFNYFLGMPYVFYLLLFQFPINFGHALAVLFLFSLGYWMFKRDKTMGFLVLSFFVFFFSLTPMKLFASGNRALVILPFIALITGITLAKFFFTKNKKIGFSLLIGVLLLVQVGESLSWMVIKWSPDPRATASVWIEKNISKNETIGVENIPIYQMLPDILLKNYYEKQYYGGKKQFFYDVLVIDPTTPVLPDTIVLTNTTITKFQRKTVKKDLLRRLQKENYQKIAAFTPDLSFYQLFGSELDFYIPIIIPAPTDISIYRKEQM